MIRQILDKMDEQNKKRLLIAFENGFSQFVDLADNTFIGVNVCPSNSIEIIETSGDWCYGRRLNV